MYSPPTRDQARSDGNIYVCTDWNWGGSCTVVGFNNGQCTNFPSGWQDNISSIGPDGGWTCQVFVYVLFPHYNERFSPRF